MAKRNRKIQTALEYAAARALLGGLGALPRPAAVAVGRGLGRLTHAAAAGLRRTGMRNLELAFPEMDEAERARLLNQSFVSLGRQLGEFSQFPKLTPEALRDLVEYDGIDILWEAKRRGRGIIFLTAHLGAWEILCFAHSALYEPISFLVRPLDNSLVEDLIERTRSRFGNRPIDKSNAARNALKLLRSGGILGVLADLNAHPKEGVFVPFFGVNACTTAGVATLALRTDATVIPVCAPWSEEKQKFVFRGDPILELVRTGDHAHDVELNTARFTAAIERQVRAHPEQWMWIHKRWKTRPAGEPDLYGKHLSTPHSSNLKEELPT